MATGLIGGRHWAAFVICQLTSIVVEDLIGPWIIVTAQKPRSSVENRGCTLPNKDTFFSRFGGADEKWFAHRRGGGGQVIIFGLGTPTLRYSESRSALGGGAGLGFWPRSRVPRFTWQLDAGFLIPRPSEAPMIYGVTTKTLKFFVTHVATRR